MKVNYLIIALSIIVMAIIFNLPFKPKPFGDDIFHREAKIMSLFLKGQVTSDKVFVIRAPGPVFYYSLPYLLVKKDSSEITYWYYAVVFNFIILTISILLLYKIGRILFSKEVGILSVLLLFLFPISFYYSLSVIGAIPAFFAVTIGLYGWLLIRGKTSKLLGFSLFVFGIWFLIINRPNAILFIPLGMIVMGYSFFTAKEYFKSYGRTFLISLIAIGVLSFLSLEGAKLLSGNNSSSSQEGLFYYIAHQGRFQFREEPFDFRYWESDVRGDSKDHQNWLKNEKILQLKIEASGNSYPQVYREFLIDDFVRHPFRFVRQFVFKSVYGNIFLINSINPTTFDFFIFKGKSGYNLFMFLLNVINILVIIGFLIFLFKEKNLLQYWLFWCLILALLIFHGVTYMEPRYLFPTRVALYIVSAYGLCKIKFINTIIHKLSRRLY